MLTTSDLNTQTIEQKTNVSDTLAKHWNIRGPTPPHVYSIQASSQTNDLLLSLETGHVMSVKSKDTSQVRFCIDAHTNKVVFADYYSNDIVFSLSCDMTWALWSKNGEDWGLSTKIKLVEEPNTGLVLNESNTIVVGDVSNDLKFYQIKN